MELPVWVHRGGISTLISYRFHNDEIIPESHKNFINSGVPYHIEALGEKRSIFVHDDFDPHRPIEEQSLYELIRDSQLISFARYRRIRGHHPVFVSHTTTEAFGSPGPIRLHDLWIMDTVTGWLGRQLITAFLSQRLDSLGA